MGTYGFTEVEAPAMLWALGDTRILGEAVLAVTGARVCSGYGAHVAAEIAGHAARRGVAVLAGASYGIEAAAHRAALAAGGRTIAVLASGLDRPYPAAHHQLLQRVAEQGLVVTAQPPGTPPTRERFLERMLLMAALSDAAVVVEAGSRSRSIRVARAAAGLGRPVGAVPGPVTSAASAGCHALIRDRTARLVTDGEEALSLSRVFRNVSKQGAPN